MAAATFSSARRAQSATHFSSGHGSVDGAVGGAVCGVDPSLATHRLSGRAVPPGGGRGGEADPRGDEVEVCGGVHIVKSRTAGEQQEHLAPGTLHQLPNQCSLLSHTKLIGHLSCASADDRRRARQCGGGHRRRGGQGRRGGGRAQRSRQAARPQVADPRGGTHGHAQSPVQVPRAVVPPGQVRAAPGHPARPDGGHVAGRLRDRTEQRHAHQPLCPPDRRARPGSAAAAAAAPPHAPRPARPPQTRPGARMFPARSAHACPL